MTLAYHEPALLAESIHYLAVRPSGMYVDVTFGGGGHSRAILSALENEGRLYAFDQDPDAAANAPRDSRFTLFPTNFRNLAETLQQAGIERVDGILADLGVSSHQFDTPARGFSFRFDAALDMRMNPDYGMTAADILNMYSEIQLTDLFSQYGELPRSKTIARALIAARNPSPIQTIEDLLRVVRPLLPGKEQAGLLAQLFQALRIEVNDEMGALKALLNQTIALLKPGGRLVVISYHSLEDRLVKHLFQTGNTDGRVETDFYGKRNNPWQVLTRKPVIPADTETAANPRARSARLRAAEKIVHPHQPAS